MNPRPVFSLGQIVATRGAIALLDSAGTTPAALLDRHLGDGQFLADWVADFMTEPEALAFVTERETRHDEP